MDADEPERQPRVLVQERRQPRQLVRAERRELHGRARQVPRRLDERRPVATLLRQGAGRQARTQVVGHQPSSRGHGVGRDQGRHSAHPTGRRGRTFGHVTATVSFTMYELDRPVSCSIGRAMEILGERWTFLILRESFYGVRRFSDIQRNLGIARNILSTRLQTLVGRGHPRARALPGGAATLRVPPERGRPGPLSRDRDADALGRPPPRRPTRRWCCATTRAGTRPTRCSCARTAARSWTRTRSRPCATWTPPPRDVTNRPART